MMLMMKRMIIQADERLLDRAREAAHSRGISIAQLVREALEKELGSARRRKPRILGAFESKPGTMSAREATERGRVPPRSWR